MLRLNVAIACSLHCRFRDAPQLIEITMAYLFLYVICRWRAHPKNLFVTICVQNRQTIFAPACQQRQQPGYKATSPSARSGRWQGLYETPSTAF